YRRKMIALVAPHRANDRDVVDHTADVRKPIGYRDAGFTVTREGAVTRNHGPFHLREVVAESHGIHDFAGPFVVFGIERVDMADAPAHEEEDHRFGLGRKMRSENGVLNFPGLRPKRSHGEPEKSASGLMEKSPPGNPPARI